MSKIAFVERPRYTCASGGAVATVTAIPGAIPILHSAQGCAGNFAWTQNGGAGLQVGGYCGSLTVPSSNVQERDVVFGGVDRLRQQIANTVEVMDGELYVVLTSCVTEVIGDDAAPVVEEFREQGTPIAFAETAGFKGNAYTGYDLVLQSLFRQVVERGVSKQKGKVNLWGIPPYQDVFWRGNIEELRRLLESLGLTVNSFFTDRDSVAAIRQAASAELNIVVSDVYGVQAAALFEERHGVPFLKTALPVGPGATDDFLLRVGERLALDRGVVDQVIRAERRHYYRTLEPLTDCYNDMDLQRYAVVVGDGNYAPALARFLADDLGWLPELVVVTDRFNEQEQGDVASRLQGFASGLAPHLVFESDGRQIISHFNRLWPPNQNQKYYNAFSPAFVLGSSLERELAATLAAGHLSVSFPVANRAVLDRGYTGYRGGLRLTEDLLSAIVAGR
ncbi:hypothetical protein GTO89_02220 [Heliobacterium gestii]|uniref:Nitrogenase/oxidoreductase component 1 domain-containing protein n=1 Tax=Heliomicrobium gestii TaxID=2699 RepID=A0A845L5E5_HELGE|nr:nitrogenase component 1 [Heliomicrobium gestii]MBM7865597.1 nitrogenase molybdenum-iron protein beta chain [Heliomicrobium gestii]MZP41847.1 hypothetical protein [Heliomicrobium gestii]